MSAEERSRELISHSLAKSLRGDAGWENLSACVSVCVWKLDGGENALTVCEKRAGWKAVERRDDKENFQTKFR